MKALEKRESQQNIGKKFGVSKSTVANIWKEQMKTAEAIASSDSQAYTNKKRCSIHSPKFNLVDEACWK